MLKVYLLTIGAIIALPFVTVWQFICKHKHTILQLLWTLILGLGGGVGLAVFIATVAGGYIVLALMSFWCYVSLTTLAMYDYQYILRRWI